MLGEWTTTDRWFVLTPSTGTLCVWGLSPQQLETNAPKASCEGFLGAVLRGFTNNKMDVPLKTYQLHNLKSLEANHYRQTLFLEFEDHKGALWLGLDEASDFKVCQNAFFPFTGSYRGTEAL